MKTPLLLAFCLAPICAFAQAPAPTATPADPKILETSPAAWSTNVDPASQTKVIVTFDQRMSPAYTAWFGRSSIPPEVDANSIMSPDRHAFASKMRLLPGKTYVMGLNEKAIPGVGFQNEKGHSAAPYYLVFQTAGRLTPDQVPPRIASTLPANGAQGLDSSKLKTVTITFDKPMATAKQGLMMKENGKPVDLTKARFAYSSDGKTFTLGYDFKAAATYELQANSTENIGFTSAARIPVWPVRFSFTTG